MRMREPTHPGFASSRFRCGFRVSHPLAAFIRPRPSSRLRPVALMGFSPSKLLPPTEPWRLSAPAALLPLLARLTKPEDHACLTRARLQGLAPRRSPSRPAGISRANARCSHGVHPLQGSSGFASRPASRPLPSQASPATPKSCRRPPRVSIRDPVGFDRAPIRKSIRFTKPVPLAVFTPRHRIRSLRVLVRSGLSPTGPAASLPLRRPSLERPRSLPQGSRRVFRCQAPGRHPTLDASICRTRRACQIIAA